ncbi:fungal-specific transcription factor domain-containing protein [Massariosphaeria phaeospora]|uniref:Fungal-specific transcription factor domain-containing protein n=1 Tax=Massariosphaeria phaeospora TaxID=100035 RepID=A0A7C8MGZ0_9PLEO|nr:fungal-specific transcription factor domain-containing protein [Massariosphaeria phaeospora]
MAATMAVPSPSLVLDAPGPSSPSSPAPPAIVKKTAAGTGNGTGRPPPPPPPPHPRAPARPADSNGATKRKQSKSRNGCVTCKAKRLKCDETKPTCQQCARRSVECGGYKKDFKWRPFEETSFGGKPPTKSRKGASSPALTPQTTPQDSDESHRAVLNNRLHHVYFAPPPSTGPAMHGLPLQTTFMEPAYPPAGDMFAMPQPSPYMLAPPPISPVDRFSGGSGESSSTMFEAESIDTRPPKTTTPSSVSSGQSPRLVDLLMPGTDLNVPPEEYVRFLSQHESFYQSTGLTPPADTMDEADVEEIPRDLNLDHEAWVLRLPSPTPSSSSSSTSDSREIPILYQPQLSTSSPEMLTRRFDRDTCGVLSLKDGPTENPWRTLIWPLARECPALFHAIASMTSFHHSKDTPSLRIQGIDHMRTSVHALASSLEKMRVDAAISTTLVLAFSESWDQHISTGINHIKGAKILIDRALVQHNQKPVLGDEFNRLKFLCNTWLYMDVIARLTSADDDETNDFDIFPDTMYIDGQVEDTQLDPLMGCAGTLFPIIGRVANLVKKVRRTDSNGPTIISQAMELKAQLEDWVPPAYIEDPEDETTSPHDSIRTAAAYQYATLLYLHQAVPEIPSLASAVLAKKVLCELATVEPRSRSTIVHIYPLMSAGCEVMEAEDREWVCSRWEQMSSRMKLGLIDKCLEVTKEVWSRRDAWASECLARDYDQDESALSTPSLKRDFGSISDEFDADGLFCWFDSGSKRRALSGASSLDSPRAAPVRFERSEGKRRADSAIEALEPEYTVKGRLHWLGVMSDWNWEVLLG